MLYQTEDGLVHLEWWSRDDETAAGPEFDEIVFPEEAEWVKVIGLNMFLTMQVHGCKAAVLMHLVRTAWHAARPQAHAL
jgi:hypothetical protein